MDLIRKLRIQILEPQLLNWLNILSKKRNTKNLEQNIVVYVHVQWRLIVIALQQGGGEKSILANTS